MIYYLKTYLELRAERKELRKKYRVAYDYRLDRYINMEMKEGIR